MSPGQDSNNGGSFWIFAQVSARCVVKRQQILAAAWVAGWSSEDAPPGVIALLSGERPGQVLHAGG